jgi:hypothetical protein
MDPRHEGIAQWLDEGREPVRGMQGRIEYLAKENERLLSAGKDNSRVQADRDQLLPPSIGWLYLVDQIRVSRSPDTEPHRRRAGPHRPAEGSSTRVAPPNA